MSSTEHHALCYCDDCNDDYSDTRQKSPTINYDVVLNGNDINNPPKIINTYIHQSYTKFLVKNTDK